MKQITFTFPSGETKTLNYPTDPTELRWMDWVEFRSLISGMSEEVEGETPELAGARQFLLICAALDVFNEGEKISDFPIFSSVDEGIDLLRPLAIGIEEVLRNTPEGLVDPDKYRVEYKGEWYSIAGREVEKIANPKYVGGANEIVSFMYYQQALDNLREAGTMTANDEFSYSLAQIACVLRKVGEPLPATPTDATAFVTQRAAHFQDLPMSVVRDVAAFFLHLSIKLLNTHVTNGSSNPPTRWNRDKRKAPTMRAMR